MIGSLSVLTGGILGTALIYFYTKENMWEGGKDNFLPIDASEEDWKLIQKSLKTNNNITDEKLKRIKNETSSNQLKKWCSEKYKETFSSLFHAADWMKLAEMKNACLLPIKKKLGKSVTIETINTDKLKNHKDDNGYKLTYRLKGIKNINDDKNMKEHLFNWCREMADHGYQGENSNVYKLVKGLCVKDK